LEILFKQGTESRSSDEVHVVQEARGKTVKLNDGTFGQHTEKHHIKKDHTQDVYLLYGIDETGRHPYPKKIGVL
jgi:hypothetical protein